MLLAPENLKADLTQLEAFFKYATIGMLATNSKGKITAINPFAITQFGYY